MTLRVATLDLENELSHKGPFMGPKEFINPP